MIEFYLFSALAGIGYLLNQRKGAQPAPPLSGRNANAKTNRAIGPRPTVNERDVPSVDNAYHARHVDRVAQKERRASDIAHHAARRPRQTNVVPNLPRGVYDETRFGASPEDGGGAISVNPSEEVLPGEARQEGAGMVRSSLTGELIPVERFTQNNQGISMQPMFGGSVTQNMDHDKASLSLDRLNGAADMFGGKRELRPMFERQSELSNVYGMQNQTDRMLEHIVAPRSRNNEFPIPRQMVGPGIGSYDAAPQDNIALEVRKHVLPRTTDELRVETNPKVTYEAPVLEGQKGRNRGSFSRFAKNAPETTFERTAANNFTTTGARIKPRKRPDHVELRDTTRPDTHVDYSGPAYAKTAGERGRAKASHEPFRQKLEGTQANPAAATDVGRGERFDHGKGSILIYGNNRDVTGAKTHKSNVTSVVKALMAPLQDVVRASKKEYTAEAHSEPVGVQPQMPSKPTLYDPNDVARTTIKQTNLYNAHGAGSLQVTAKKPRVYDSDAVARTTVRETTGNPAHGVEESAGFKGSAAKGVVYDPDAIARTTVKEATLAEAPHANVRQVAYRSAAYDPDDVARTTVKEATLAGAPDANVRQVAYKSTAYDPDDVARTTVKEATLAEAPDANVRQVAYKSTAYDPDAVARTTVKEATLAEAPDANVRQSAYKSTAYDPDAVARTTVKETGLHDTHGLGSVVGGKLETKAYPTDAAKTTGKETVEDVIGEAQGTRNVVTATGAMAPRTYDPDQVARTTVKETTLDEEQRGGNVDGLQGERGAYATIEVKAPHTQKETVHTREYVGGATIGDGAGGYEVANPEAKQTQKQTLSDRDYFGTAADQGAKAPSSYADMYNATLNEVRELTLRGREPTKSGTKVAPGPETVELQDVRVPSLPNAATARLQDEEVMYNAEPPPGERGAQVTDFDIRAPEVTRDRQTYDIADRLDVSTMDALNSNPFAIPSFSAE
jgi:hypothetical protein